MTTTHFRDPLTATSAKIAEVIASGRTPVLQFRSAPAADVLERTNDFCREFGTDVQVRFFSWEWKPFDAGILTQVPDVANLRLDTLRAIDKVEFVAGLPKLKRLGFAVHEHPDGAFLKQLPLDQFSFLGLGANKKRNFDLLPLTRATALEELFIQGHDRRIEAIARLPKLQDVSLSGFPKRHDLTFLNSLGALRSLLLILGARQSIAEFSHADLRKLRIVWVRYLEVLGPLARFSKLEELSIEDQRRLTSLDLNGLNLRRLHIANCKALERIDGLDAQPRLERLLIRDTKLPDERRESSSV